MKYRIFDKANKEYLDLTKYCVNGYGDVMTTNGIVLMNQSDFKIEIVNKIEIINEVKYYLIIGGYINEPMGCCTSLGIKDVHHEEPDAKFYEISKEEFEQFDKNIYTHDRDWLSISKSFNET